MKKTLARKGLGAVDPRRFGLGETASQRMAIAVLSALSIAGVHSALNPSLFTLMSFAARPEAKARAMKGLWIGFGASTAASVAIWVIFEDWIPALVSEATAAALFFAGIWALKQPTPIAIPAIEEQEGQGP